MHVHPILRVVTISMVVIHFDINVQHVRNTNWLPLHIHFFDKITILHNVLRTVAKSTGWSIYMC